MKRFSKTRLGLVLIAGLAVAMVMSSAPAAPVGGGIVTGNVTITKPATGIPLTGCVPTEYSFASVVLQGAIANGNNRYTGAISTSGVKGKSTGCESLNSAKGTVNSAAAPASFSGGGGKITGKFWGTFTRTGPLVMVKLSVVQCKINGKSVPNFQVRLDLSLFIPTTVNANGVKKATFIGEFHTGNV